MLIIIGGSVLCYVGALLLAKPVLMILYNEKIAEYSYLMSGIIIYIALNGIMWFFYNVLIIFRSIMSILIVNATAFIVCLLISRKLILRYSMSGVNYAMIVYTGLSVVLMGILIFIGKRKIMKG